MQKAMRHVNDNKKKKVFLLSTTSKSNDLFAIRNSKDCRVRAKMNSWCFLLKKYSLISANWITIDSQTILTKLRERLVLMSDGKHDNCNWV